MGQKRSPGVSYKTDLDTEILVVAVGNQFKGDDGIGPFVARKLESKNLPKTLVKFHDGDGTSLMELWIDAHMVILLDAVSSGGQPGRIFRFNALRQRIPGSFFMYSTHNFGLAETVELARTLNRLPPCLIIYGIEGKNFGEGLNLSPEVRRVAKEVVKKVINDIYERIGSNSISSRV
ncbi:MAG: hypothetical protein AMK69_04830 [Nitrospira bacterium SG8_3]|nr:MAG: hypothetical protein AMK69_04830 [Nitrospira bacterium SG8_3]